MEQQKYIQDWLNVAFQSEVFHTKKDEEHADWVYQPCITTALSPQQARAVLEVLGNMANCGVSIFAVLFKIYNEFQYQLSDLPEQTSSWVNMADKKKYYTFTGEEVQRQVTLGTELFRFNSFDQWCDKARSWFKNRGVSGHDTVCIDTKGRICMVGKEFSRAKKEDAFPVRVYHIDPSVTANFESHV